MTTDLRMLELSVILYFVMVLLPTILRVKGWTVDGMMLMFGNREDLPDMTPAVARADRAAKNMAEALLMFIPVVFLARAAGAPDGDTALGAELFFFARLVYLPLYIAGVRFLRTGVWLVSIVGMILILAQV